jgi:hypothetical protein
MAAASAMKAATKASVRSAVEASAMHTAPETTVHTSPKTGPAAEGVLVCYAAVVKSAECAGVAAWRHVRRSEATIGSMVEVASEIVATSEIVAVSEVLAAVDKGMAP